MTNKELKTYEVIFDRESTHIEVDAENKEEAKKLAQEQFEKRNEYTDYGYWIGEVIDQSESIPKKELKCCVCNEELPDRFQFILVHSATREDVKRGGFSNVKKEMFCCNDCGDNLNFRELEK